MNVARRQARQAPKRVTLAVTLIRLRTAQALDDRAEMCIRWLQKLPHQGQEALEE